MVVTNGSNTEAGLAESPSPEAFGGVYHRAALCADPLDLSPRGEVGTSNVSAMTDSPAIAAALKFCAPLPDGGEVGCEAAG
jgi:hypothetical protein